MTDTTMAPDDTPSQTPRPARRSLGGTILRLALALVLLAVLGVLGVVGIFIYYGRDLPSFEKLSDYDPPQTTKVFDRNGVQVAEFAHERRTVVPKDKVPKLFKSAVIAAEDAAFYEHTGLDYMGIARAVLKNVSHLHMSQGASTITQQIVKNMVLSPEKSVARKVKEAILARRLEQNLTKEDILFLYVNHIYFGHTRYGVEEASQFFFGKSVDRLGVGEAALLAGLPQSPQRLSPINHPERAKARQVYVLQQMAKNGFISQQQADQEMARPIVLAPSAFEQVGPYYAEDVRRALVERYGEQKVYEGGLRVDLGMDRAIQALADQQLRLGLEELDHKFGWKAAEVAVDLKVLAQARPKLAEKAKSVGTRDRLRQPLIGWDFSKVTRASAGSAEALVEAVNQEPLEPFDARVVPVVAVDDEGATVDSRWGQGDAELRAAEVGPPLRGG
ncbi:MAG: transglycosylase domain-containing protein [Myxococcales bacterium]